MEGTPAPTKKWHSKLQPSTSPSLPQLSARDKTVIVTGGGSGIGAETARFFAQAGAARIALLGRREQPLLDTKVLIEKESPATQVTALVCDATKKQDVDSAFSKFLGSEKVDVLISCAAIVGNQEGPDDVEPELLLKDFQIQLSSAIHTAQAFSRHAAPGAVAIEVNSSAAHLNYAPKFVSYSVSKFAVYRLWDTFAFAHPNLRIYHLQPGVIDTDMNKEAGGVKAIGHADDVAMPAGFMLWLASPEGAFLKGKFLWANWDVDELKAREAEIKATRLLNIDLVGWPFGQAQDWKAEITEGTW